jgi:prepilin-type N-terminal cleavage/methylation domain-containing protein
MDRTQLLARASRPPARNRPPCRRRRGMTLLEIVIVLTMMATVTAIALPNMLDLREQTALTNAAHIFARDLNRARVEAGRRNESIAVFRVGSRHYRIEGLANQTLPDGVRFAEGFDSVRFASFGPVKFGAGAYELALGDQRKGIRIETAGFAYVQR